MIEALLAGLLLLPAANAAGATALGIKDAQGPVALWPTVCAERLRGLGLLDAQEMPGAQ